MARLLVTLLAAAPLASLAQEPPPAPPAAPAAAHPPPGREGVYVGAGLGVASMGEPSSGRGSAMRIRVGIARSPRLLVGLEGGLSRFAGDALNTYDVGVTVFPWERYGFFRAAVGLTTRSYDTAVRIGGVGSAPNTTTEQGSNLLLGTGLAVGGARGLDVSLNVELQAHWTKATDRPSGSPVQILTLWLGLDWT